METTFQEQQELNLCAVNQEGKLERQSAAHVFSVFVFGDGVLLRHTGWSAVVQSQFTAASVS